MRWAAGSLLLFIAGLALHVAGAPGLLTGVVFAACYVAGGWEPAVAGVRALAARTLDVDLLMVVAALGAAAIGQVVDGGLLIVIFATSGALEAFATRRTQEAVHDLADLTPPQATLLTTAGADGEGTRGGPGSGSDPGSDGAARERTVAAQDLVPGDMILVRPGERLPADGAVIDGSSEVQQASITGEPLPVDKHVGAEVYAGTVNGAGALVVEVTRPARESVLARIADMVAEASRTKSRTQLFIERIEQRYSVGVVVASLVIFGVPLLVGVDPRDALLRTMTFMIVASPCAVVLATMPPLLSAIATAGRHGVLVKSAVVMEQLGSPTVVAFDKTGTLTTGEPSLVAVLPLPGSPYDEEGLLALAGAAEQSSEHPLGRAVVAAARSRGLDLAPAHDFRAEVGRGVTARVGGDTVTVRGPDPQDGPGVQSVTAAEEDRGRTTVVVRANGAAVGILSLVDEPRSEAPGALAALRAELPREPVLLTGDNPRAAARLGAHLGILDVRAGLLPQDKVDAVRALQATGERVLVVGDGVNDAPALAAGDVGVAMGRSGSDLALSTADAVIVGDDLGALVAVVRLSRRARRLVIENLAIAATVIVVLVTWDLVGHLPLPLGVAGHEGSSILVALNGLRLLRSTEWRPAEA